MDVWKHLNTQHAQHHVTYFVLYDFSGDGSLDSDESPKSRGMGGPEYSGLGYRTGLFLQERVNIQHIATSVNNY